MFKITLFLILSCVLLLNSVYGVRFEVVDSNFNGQLSGYAGDQPYDDPGTPEREEDQFNLQGASLNINTITQNSALTLWNDRTAYAQAQIDGCGLIASYDVWSRTENYGDGSASAAGKASISMPANSLPNTRFIVVLDNESSLMPFIAHLSLKLSLYNYHNGTYAAFKGTSNNEILVQLTRNTHTTTLYSHSLSSLTDEGTYSDSYNMDVTVYAGDIISIYGGTETRVSGSLNGSTSSYADLYINLELDPDECPADIAQDYLVNLQDFMVLADYWLSNQNVPFPVNGVVDTPELIWMADWWLWKNTAGCPVWDFATALVLNKEYRGTTNGEGSHWYQFTPPVGGKYSFELLCRDFDSVLNIYEPGIIQGYDLLYSVRGDLLVPTLIQNQPYYLEISGMDGDTGTYILKTISGVVVPANDFCGNRINITMNYGTDWAWGETEGRTVGATGQDETPGCGTNDVQDVWYSVALPLAGQYSIILEGLDDAFIGSLAIFDGIGTCPGTLLSCTQQTSVREYTEITYTGQANETIIIRAASSDLASGKFKVVLNFIPPSI